MRCSLYVILVPRGDSRVDLISPRGNVSRSSPLYGSRTFFACWLCIVHFPAIIIRAPQESLLTNFAPYLSPSSMSFLISHIRETSLYINFPGGKSLSLMLCEMDAMTFPCLSRWILAQPTSLRVIYRFAFKMLSLEAFFGQLILFHNLTACLHLFEATPGVSWG